MPYRARSIPARAGLCLTPSLASIGVAKLPALKSFGAEQGLLFLDISVALPPTSGLMWSRPRPAGRAPPRKPSNLQVLQQPSVVTGLEAAVSIAAAIPSPLGNQRACSKTNQVKFVVLLASACVASSEHERCGGGEHSPWRGLCVGAGPGGTAGQQPAPGPTLKFSLQQIAPEEKTCTRREAGVVPRPSCLPLGDCNSPVPLPPVLRHSSGAWKHLWE